jgi:hypothetical protein
MGRAWLSEHHDVVRGKVERKKVNTKKEGMDWLRKRFLWDSGSFKRIADGYYEIKDETTGDWAFVMRIT